MSALCGAVTHPGRARQAEGHNEDALWVPTHLDPSLVNQCGALYVVADGIGGHANGEVASQLAVETMRTVYYQNANPDRRQALYQTVLAANTAIYQSTQGLTGGAANRMGSTVVAVVVKDNQVMVANLGDSRAYLVRGGQAHVLSQDHTVVAELLRRQLISVEEAATHPDRSSLMRSLGQEASCQPFVSDWLPLQASDRIVVCTDGLWDVVGDATLARLSNRGTPDAAARALVNAANERGGPDNITVIVIGDATPVGAGWLAPIMAAPVLWLAGGIGLVFLTAILVIALAGAGTLPPTSTPFAQAVPSPVATPPMGTAIPTEPMTPASVPAQLTPEAVAPVHAAPEPGAATLPPPAPSAPQYCVRAIPNEENVYAFQQAQDESTQTLIPAGVPLDEVDLQAPVERIHDQSHVVKVKYGGREWWILQYRVGWMDAATGQCLALENSN